MKIENFKIAKIFIDTRKIRTGDLLRITKEDGIAFEGIVSFNTVFKYYNKNNNEFEDIILSEIDATDIESIEILNKIKSI